MYREAHFFCIVNPQKFINPPKYTFPKPGKHAENNFALSRPGNGQGQLG